MEANKDVHASLQSVGESLHHLPVVAFSVSNIDQRWDASKRTLLSRKEELEQAAEAWKEYEQTQLELKLLLEDVEGNLAGSDVDILSVDVEKLQNQKANHQVGG